MEHKIDVKLDKGICTIKVSGIHKRPEDSYKLLRIAGQAYKENGCSRFIFDMREAKIISTVMGALETVLNPEQYGVNSHFYIAAIYSKLDKDNLFMESVGTSRGATAFRVFENFDKAHNWINSDVILQ